MSRLIRLAAAGFLVAAPAQAHDWYTGLMNRQGVSCCNDRDCHPVDSCRLSSGAEGIHVLGMCRPIPWDLVLSVPSPDGQHHACWWTFNGPYGPEPRFRCIILAGGA